MGRGKRKVPWLRRCEGHGRREPSRPRRRGWSWTAESRRRRSHRRWPSRPSKSSPFSETKTKFPCLTFLSFPFFSFLFSSLLLRSSSSSERASKSALRIQTLCVATGFRGGFFDIFFDSFRSCLKLQTSNFKLQINPELDHGVFGPRGPRFTGRPCRLYSFRKISVFHPLYFNIF